MIEDQLKELLFHQINFCISFNIPVLDRYLERRPSTYLLEGRGLFLTFYQCCGAGVAEII